MTMPQNDKISPNIQWPHTGAILAGGKSTRMGRPKASLRLWNDQTMIEHVLNALGGVCSKVVIVGGGEDLAIQTNERLLRIEDIHPGKGPISGIEALLASGLDTQYLVATCDQPLLNPAILEKLVSGSNQDLRFFSEEEGKRLDPFPGVFPSGLLPSVQEAISTGAYSLRQLIQHFKPTWVTLPSEDIKYLTNINTPTELALVVMKGL